MAGKLVGCQECFCVLYEHQSKNHIEWHAQLARAIMLASGILTAEQIEEQMDLLRRRMIGKISTIADWDRNANSSHRKP